MIDNEAGKVGQALKMVLLSGVMGLALVACDDAPSEDEAASETGSVVEEAEEAVEEAVDAVEDTAEEAVDAVEDAAEEAVDAVEEAVEVDNRGSGRRC